MSYSATLPPLIERRKHARQPVMEDFHSQIVFGFRELTITFILAVVVMLAVYQRKPVIYDSSPGIETLAFPGPGTHAVYRWDGFHRIAP